MCFRCFSIVGLGGRRTVIGRGHRGDRNSSGVLLVHTRMYSFIFTLQGSHENRGSQAEHREPVSSLAVALGHRNYRRFATPLSVFNEGKSLTRQEMFEPARQRYRSQGDTSASFVLVVCGFCRPRRLSRGPPPPHERTTYQYVSCVIFAHGLSELSFVPGLPSR